MMMKRRLKVTVTTVRRTMTLARHTATRDICPLCGFAAEKQIDNLVRLVEIHDRNMEIILPGQAEEKGCYNCGGATKIWNGKIE